MQNIRRCFCTLLILALLLQTIPAMAVDARPGALTCREAAALLEEDRLSDILGEESGDALLTNGSAAQLILNFFGTLPAPRNLRLLVGFFDTQFEDVSPQYDAAVSNLTSAGLWVTDDLEHFHADALMTRSEFTTLRNRVYAYLGTSFKDDLANTANHDRYYDLPNAFDEDTTYSSLFFSYLVDTDAATNWFVEQLHPDPSADDENAQRIAACVSTWEDMDARLSSLEQLQPYLAGLMEASNVQEMLEAHAAISRDLGVELLLERDEDATFPVPVGGFGDETSYYFKLRLDPPEKYAPGTWLYDYDLEQIQRILCEYGLDEEAARRMTEAQLSYLHDCAVVAENQPSGLTSIPKSIEDFIRTYLGMAGYISDAPVVFSDLPSIVGQLSCFDDAHLEGIRSLGIVRLLEAFVGVLPPRLADRLLRYYDDWLSEDVERYQGFSMLYHYLIPMVQWSMTQRFLSSSDGRQLEAEMEQWIDWAVDAYREMLEATDWMQEETKKKALEKLESMRFVYLAPEAYTSQWTPDYISREDGGTLIDNVILYRQSMRQEANDLIARRTSPLSASVLYCGALTMNAFYLPEQNACYIPLGALTDGQFMAAQTPEDILGSALLFTLGHEISHAFDNEGRRYDSHGNLADWWTEEDDKAYLAQMKKLAELYDGYEYGPGLSQSGMTVINEAIADNGSIACALKLAQNFVDFDYARFFTNVARLHGFITNRLSYENLVVDDPHPVGRARINPLVACFDEFYTAFDVEAGDAMFVPAEERVNFWGASAPEPNVELVERDGLLILTGILPGTILQDLENALQILIEDNTAVTFRDSNGADLAREEPSATGIQAVCGEKSVFLAVAGDALGTGDIHMGQLVCMAQNLAGALQLSPWQTLAVDHTKDGTVDVADIVIEAHYLAGQ